MLKMDILERESWRVTEEDSKEGGEGWNRGRKLREGFTNEKAGATAV